MDIIDKDKFKDQISQNEREQLKEDKPQINEKGDRIKTKGLLPCILKNGMLYTALPLCIIYWMYFYLTTDHSHFPKALIYSFIIFPPFGIIAGYTIWLNKLFKKT